MEPVQCPSSMRSEGRRHELPGGTPGSGDRPREDSRRRAGRRSRRNRPALAQATVGRVVLGLALLLAPSAGRAEPATPPPAASASGPLVAPPAPSATPRPAAEPGRGSPFSIRLAAELPLTLGAGVLALTTELVKSELPGPACGTGCDPGGINALDRLGLGSHSRGARTASDLLVGVNVGLPFVIDLFDVLGSHPLDGWRGYGADVVVLAEVLAVNAGLNGLVKNAVRRPRPLVYDADPDAVPPADRLAPDAALSFYSEHSSTSFAMATAYSFLFMRRHPGSRLIVPVWLISEALATTTAALRVAAGKHFITDVLTGAAVGSALGLLIPYLHQRAPAGASATWASRVRATPLAYPGGGGLLLTLE